MSALPRLSGPELEAAIRKFDLPGELEGFTELRRGHIHDTYVSTWRSWERGGTTRRFLHQRMNDAVFEDIPALMHNVSVVTRHLSKAAEKADDASALDDNTAHLTALQLVRATDGGDYVIANDTPWRTYHFVEGTQSYDHPKDASMAHAAACAFGDFQVRLSSLDPADLRVTIPNFFNSEARLSQLDDACRRDPKGRKAEVQVELDLIGERREQASVMERALRDRRMPPRVVHGDTKLNNVLFDEKRDVPRCIVDLDTCMPGYSLFDFGDLVRFTAATADEDERDLSQVTVDMELYAALREGYLRHAHRFLNSFERDHMAFSARLVSLTLAMRFLADHILGDVYFKVSRPGQNLDRARVQIRLVEEMEKRFPSGD
ncbi:MAG: aminoglycoside phosphotransferase family protein [Planctomycetota bacterium]